MRIILIAGGIIGAMALLAWLAYLSPKAFLLGFAVGLAMSHH